MFYCVYILLHIPGVCFFIYRLLHSNERMILHIYVITHIGGIFLHIDLHFIAHINGEGMLLNTLRGGGYFMYLLLHIYRGGGCYYSILYKKFNLLPSSFLSLNGSIGEGFQILFICIVAHIGGMLLHIYAIMVTTHIRRMLLHLAPIGQCHVKFRLSAVMSGISLSVPHLWRCLESAYRYRTPTRQIICDLY